MRKLIAGNWKMNFTNSEAKGFVNSLREIAKNPECDVVLCAPFTSLATVKTACQNSPFSVGSQNIAWTESGAFTGEISAPMLKEIGVEYAIIGHSERRAMFGESNETVNKRLHHALKHDIKPIFCVGETLDERKSGATNRVLKAQIEGGLTGFSEEEIARIVIAYEPVWAIGTSLSATPQEAGEAISFIRSLVGQKSRILYGGSMNGTNAPSLLAQNIDGGLIGGASLKSEEFAKIIEAASK